MPERLKAGEHNRVVRGDIALAEPELAVADVAAVQVVQGSRDLAEEEHVLVREEGAMLEAQLLRGVQEGLVGQQLQHTQHTQQQQQQQQQQQCGRDGKENGGGESVSAN